MVDVSKLPLIDNPALLDAFGDDFVGSFYHNGNFHFTLSVFRTTSDDPPKPTRAVSVRVAMPLKAAIDLHNGLGRILATLESTGDLKGISEGPETVQ